jgi:hypothetical protein
MTAIVVYNKTSVAATPAVRPRSRITKPMTGGRPTNDPKGSSLRFAFQVDRCRSSRDDRTARTRGCRRRCGAASMWAAAQDAASRPSKQEAIKKQRVAVKTQSARRRTRREAK